MISFFSISFFLYLFFLRQELDKDIVAMRGVRLMGSCLWWCKNIMITVCSIFFLVFGIETLVGAFHLNNPFEFIMYFFSASLMIMVCLVGILYPAFQVHSFFRPRKLNKDAE